MATEQKFYELVGRLVADPDLRAKLVDKGTVVLKELGYDLTKEQVESLSTGEIIPAGNGVCFPCGW